MFMFSASEATMKTSVWFLATLVAALHCDAQSQEATTEAMMLTSIDKCPCLPIVVCPHVYGSNPEDIKYLGIIMKCANPKDVRCCGASTSKTTSKVVLPINLPEEYKVRVEPSPVVTVLPAVTKTITDSPSTNVTSVPETVAEVELLKSKVEMDGKKLNTDQREATTVEAEAVTESEAEPTTTEIVSTEESMTEAITEATTSRITTASTTARSASNGGAAEGRSMKFTALEIEQMKQRLRETLRQRQPDLIVEESVRVNRVKDFTTTAAPRNRSRKTKSPPVEEEKPLVSSTRPLNETLGLMILRFDTKKRQNFLKRPIVRPPTTTEVPGIDDRIMNVSMNSVVDAEHQNMMEQVYQELQPTLMEPDNDDNIAEGSSVDNKEFVEVPEDSVEDRFVVAYRPSTTTPNVVRSRGRMRFTTKIPGNSNVHRDRVTNHRQTESIETATPHERRTVRTRPPKTRETTQRTGNLFSIGTRPPRRKMIAYPKQTISTTTTTAASTTTTTEDTPMIILNDVNHQIKENHAQMVETLAKEIKTEAFKESPLFDFYFEKEEDVLPQQTTSRDKRLSEQVQLEGGFLPIILS